MFEFYKKLLSILLMFNIFSLPISQIKAQENLSPIESVDFGANQENQSSEKTEETGVEPEEETDSMQESEAEGSDEKEKKSFKNPLDFVSHIESGLSQSSGHHVVFEIVNGETKSSQRSYLRDNDIYSIEDLGLDYLPYNVFLKVDKGELKEAYLSVDNLINYAQRMLEENPDAKDSVIEEFVDKSKDHLDELKGKAIQVEADTSDNQRAYSIVELNELLLKVTKEWIQDEAVKEKGKAMESGIAFELDETTGAIFEELVNQYKDDYLTLEPILSLFDEGYRGTVSFAYEKNEIGFGLVGGIDENIQKGLEHYVSLQPIKISLPEEDNILTPEEFHKIIGLDYLSELDKINDQAQTKEE